MNARTKLNAAHVCGAIVLAAVAGLLTQSSLVFLLTAAVLIVLGLHDRSIRLRGRR